MYDELIDDLRETAEYIGPNNYELPIMLYDNLLKAADAIEELQRLVEVNNASRWISVEERLPETYTEVLVAYIAYNSGETLCDMCAYIDGDGEWILAGQGKIVTRPITHWMPLPSAPAEE